MSRLRLRISPLPLSISCDGRGIWRIVGLRCESSVGRGEIQFRLQWLPGMKIYVVEYFQSIRVYLSGQQSWYPIPPFIPWASRCVCVCVSKGPSLSQIKSQPNSSTTRCGNRWGKHENGECLEMQVKLARRVVLRSSAWECCFWQFMPKDASMACCIIWGEIAIEYGEERQAIVAQLASDL